MAGANSPRPCGGVFATCRDRGIVGDAGGSVNPFNGEGIDYAYETGRLAAELVAEAVICDDGLALARYPELL